MVIRDIPFGGVSESLPAARYVVPRTPYSYFQRPLIRVLPVDCLRADSTCNHVLANVSRRLHDCLTTYLTMHRNPGFQPSPAVYDADSTGLSAVPAETVAYCLAPRLRSRRRPAIIGMAVNSLEAAVTYRKVTEIRGDLGGWGFRSVRGHGMGHDNMELRGLIV